MKRFLDILTVPRLHRQHRRTWIDALGVPLCNVLLAEGVLERAPAADWYPCEGGGIGCPRAVVPSGLLDKPFVAVCRHGDGDDCGEVYLAQSDLEQLKVSFSRFVDLVRRRMSIEGGGESPIAARERAIHIGDVRRGVLHVDVLIALNPDPASFSVFLAERSHWLRPTIVLVPTAASVSEELRRAYGLGKHAEIRFLEDVLTAHDDGDQKKPSRAAAPPAAPSRAPTCIYIGHDGERTLTAEEYAATVAEAPKRLDAFLDGVTPQRAGRARFFRAGRRAAGGDYEQTRVTDTGVAVLTELIARRDDSYVVPHDLEALQACQSADEFFKHARRAIDATPWRLIERRAGSSKDDRAYRFHPRPDVRFAVLLPLPSSA